LIASVQTVVQNWPNTPYIVAATSIVRPWPPPGQAGVPLFYFKIDTKFSSAGRAFQSLAEQKTESESHQNYRYSHGLAWQAAA
jgi:hypothetical protein